MVPHVKAVSRPFGRWPKASLYMGMMHDPRSSPGAAADTLPKFIGKKLRIHTGANKRLDHLYQDLHRGEPRLLLHYGDMTDSTNLIRLLQQIVPDEVYNLAAQSHV